MCSSDLMGWTTCMESAISNMLPRGQFVKFDPSGLLRGDFKTQIEALKAAKEASFINADEGRAHMEMGPIAGGLGKAYIQPQNFVPLGFDPATVAMPKTVEQGTDAGGKAPAAGGKTQVAEPAGARSLKNLQCWLSPTTGKAEYYDARTGDTVHREDNYDQES